jgi:hypothetical protein
MTRAQFLPAGKELGDRAIEFQRVGFRPRQF